VFEDVFEEEESPYLMKHAVQKSTVIEDAKAIEDAINQLTSLIH
jgi:hypothetical protein